MASKTAYCGTPSCRKMWAAALIMLAPVASLLLWPVVSANVWGPADGEPTIFTECVTYDPPHANSENLTDSEQAVFTVCVLLDQPEQLSRDAVYVGSATLAGLAIFGSLIGIRISDAIKSSIRQKKGGAIMLVFGPYVLALFHIWLMVYYDSTQPPLAIFLVSLALIMVTVGGYVLMEEGRASARKYTIHWWVPTAGKGTACENIEADGDDAAFARALKMRGVLRGHGDYSFELRGPGGRVVGTG